MIGNRTSVSATMEATAAPGVSAPRTAWNPMDACTGGINMSARADHPTRPPGGAFNSDEMVAWAKRQGLVQLSNGRVGRLVFWPIPGLRRQLNKGTTNRARVEFPGGSRISVRTEDVVSTIAEARYTPDPADDGTEVF